MEQGQSRKIESDSKNTIHFGVLINSNKKYLKINREDYAKIGRLLKK